MVSIVVQSDGRWVVTAEEGTFAWSGGTPRCAGARTLPQWVEDIRERMPRLEPVQIAHSLNRRIKSGNLVKVPAEELGATVPKGT